MVAKLQAQIVGCNPNGTTTAMVDCLRKVDAKMLAESVKLLKFFDQEPLIPFTAATETLSPENPEPFMVENPVQVIRNGRFNNVPWISGVVQDEGILRVARKYPSWILSS